MRTPSLPSRPPTLVAKYYLYQATMTFGFFSPIWVVFLLSRDLSYTQIALLGSLSAGISVVGELPTGYVGDRWGRRTSLLLGATLLAGSVYALAVAQSFAGFVVIYALWALGGAFRSGSGDAWLYDVLDERLDADRYTTVRGRGGAVNMTVGAASMLGAGALYAIDPALPFWIAGTVNVAGVVVLLTMPTVDPTPSDGDDGAGDDADLGIRETASVLRTELFAPHVRSVVLGVALFFGATITADSFVQPIAVDHVGLSPTALGPLYTAFSLVAAVASYNADRLQSALGRRSALWVVPVVVGALLVLPVVLAPIVALPVFFVLKASKQALHPIASGFVNDNVDSVGRATVLSAASMCYAAVRFVLKPLGGLVADAFGPLSAFATIGAFLAATVLVTRGLAALTETTEADAPVRA
ncbi:MFS transporter [Halorubellus salinus]|uniref:MFS transporter n=1 Tax=Halorubellus salinus TaxID=755309 RepID=UPI001D097543|nr:MFS transporter [Halorubellus salinus]